jgi:iron complex transport system substrate-binding protein
MVKCCFNETATTLYKFGKICVPLKPQRIIALDPRITLDPLVALGIKSIDFASYNGKGKESLFGVYFDEVKGTQEMKKFCPNMFIYYFQRQK